MYWLIPVIIIITILMIYSLLNKSVPEKPYPIPEGGKALTWIIHMYPPYHNAGAEWMAHCLNRYLVKEHGYTIYVFIPGKRFLGITRFDPTTVYEGVHIYDIKNEAAMEHAVKYSNAICGHLDFSNSVRKYAKEQNKPYIHFLHNSFESNKMRKWKADRWPTYLVANSEWIREFYSSFGFPTKVLYPPVFWQDYATSLSAERKLITLINLNKNKGGHLLPEIATRMPDLDFAGVKGGYDKQIVKSNIKNIKYFPNTPHIQDIYAQTKILLVPSSYESWGRVAVEAMSSGIPVIANPTPGLREALGNAGIFCHRDDLSSWIKEIRRLCENESYYAAVSERCRKRAQELDPLPQMDSFAEWINNLPQNDQLN
jgi:glycosyltransferase involved in cell wall biosynthesis